MRTNIDLDDGLVEEAMRVTGEKTKTALVTPDSAEATLSGTAGAECRVKINPDNSVDGQCNQIGGTLYVIFRN